MISQIKNLKNNFEKLRESMESKKIESNWSHNKFLIYYSLVQPLLLKGPALLNKSDFALSTPDVTDAYFKTRWTLRISL